MLQCHIDRKDILLDMWAMPEDCEVQISLFSSIGRALE